MELWNNPVQVVYDWLMGLFAGWGMPPDLAAVLINLIGIVVLVSAAMVLDIVLVWVERKVGNITVDRWQGEERVQLRLVDIALG